MKLYHCILVPLFYAIPLLAVCVAGWLANAVGWEWLDARCERFLQDMKEESAN